MEIECPVGGTRVAVSAGSGSGSGSGAGTICVRGIVTGAEWQKGVVVRVRVLAGHVGSGSLPGPVPKLPGDVDAVPVSEEWCARDVPVPASSPAGTPLTAVAWLLEPGGSGSGSASEVDSEHFFGVVGGAGTTDCCAGCGSGSGSGASGLKIASAGGQTPAVPKSPPLPPPPLPPGLA